MLKCVKSCRNLLLYNFELPRACSPRANSQLVMDKLLGEKHHQFVRNQDFGPVPVAESNNKDGHLASSFDYIKRTHLVYDGVAYKDLPIARVSARWNNTIITMLTPNIEKICKVSCRDCGFFNAKKKTELAGEVTGKTAAIKALEKGCGKHVRVVIKGIGPGRKPSINGLVQGGMKVVSISDITPLTMTDLPRRPRAIRRL